MDRRQSIILLAALIALKATLVLLDGAPSVFMGDSGAYLYTALHGYLPHDRGFFYGFLLRPLAIWPHSLRFLVFAQATMSAISAWLIAVNLTGVFSIPFRWAALLSFLCAMEPLQLLSERYILTDTTALFLFTILVTLVLSFCRHRTGTRLALALFTGAVLIGVRISYLPVVLLNSLALPCLWLFSRFTRSSGKSVRLVAMFLLWIGAGQLFLYGYRRLNAAVLNVATPEYFYMDGFILLSDVAPIVTAADFPPGLPGARILSQVVPPLSDPLMREAQIFASNGLCATLHRVVPDEYQANNLAKKTAMHAIVTHPVAFGRLAIHTWSEYFDVPQLLEFLRVDEGGIRPGDEAFRAEIQKSMGTDFGAQPTSDPIRLWHRAAIPWYWFLVLAPAAIPFLCLWARRRIDVTTALILAYSLVFFAQTLFFSTHAIPRYLMAPAWIMLLLFGAVFRSAGIRLTSQTTDVPGVPPAPVN